MKTATKISSLVEFKTSHIKVRVSLPRGSEFALWKRGDASCLSLLFWHVQGQGRRERHQESFWPASTLWGFLPALGALCCYHHPCAGGRGPVMGLGEPPWISVHTGWRSKLTSYRPPTRCSYTPTHTVESPCDSDLVLGDFDQHI